MKIEFKGENPVEKIRTAALEAAAQKAASEAGATPASVAAAAAKAAAEFDASYKKEAARASRAERDSRSGGGVLDDAWAFAEDHPLIAAALAAAVAAGLYYGVPAARAALFPEEGRAAPRISAGDLRAI